MKIAPIASIIWLSTIGIMSFSCSRSSVTNKIDTESADTKADSVVYLLTVDSVSVPIRLNEMGDFPVYSKDGPYPFAIADSGINYKDTKYLHFLNGQMLEGKQREKVLRKLKYDDIESIEFTPAEEAMQDYGQKASHGIIYIETKNKK